MSTLRASSGMSVITRWFTFRLTGSGGFQQRRSRGHLDRFGHRAQLQREVGGGADTGSTVISWVPFLNPVFSAVTS